MDENTWRFAQTIMWLIGLQTAFITAVLGFIWSNLSKRIEKMEDRMTRLETDMVEVKTVLRMKECCMINDSSQLKKAE
jgi:HAMP domain-containing protein